jgi:hypothetical protein
MDTDDEEIIETTHVHAFQGTDIEAAKAFVQQNLRDGVTCPACGQFCKVYKRKLNSTMALALVLIYQFFKKNPHADWLHVAAFLVKVKRDSSIAGGDVVKLRYWGLLVRAAGDRDDGSDRVGRYKITDVGKQFVEGRIAVPRYVYLYNQLLLRLSEEMTTMREALSDKFNYDELMKG